MLIPSDKSVGVARAVKHDCVKFCQRRKLKLEPEEWYSVCFCNVQLEDRGTNEVESATEAFFREYSDVICEDIPIGVIPD
eukprot:104526-Hanusia_phi.AAC.1